MRKRKELEMKILGMGVPELAIILIVVLLIFGPKNLPKLGAALGKTVKGLREGMAPDVVEDEAEEEEEIVEEEAPAPKSKKRLAAADEAEEAVEAAPAKKRVVKKAAKKAE